MVYVIVFEIVNSSFISYVGEGILYVFTMCGNSFGSASTPPTAKKIISFLKKVITVAKMKNNFTDEWYRRDRTTEDLLFEWHLINTNGYP